MPVDEINELINRIVEQISPLKIYLFGSFAAGTQTEDSDYDFYIVVDDSNEDVLKLTTQAYKAIRHWKTRPVDIIVNTKSRFESRKGRPSLEWEVENKGMLLYGK